MNINWFILKVTLQSAGDFNHRRGELIGRFRNAKPFSRQYGKRTYTYELTDISVEVLHGQRCIFGHIIRHPKVVHGRKVDQKLKTTTESKRHIDDLSDSTEFIYHLSSCQMAIHDRSPFKPTEPTLQALRAMLGKPVETAGKFDVHIEVHRHGSYTDRLFEDAKILTDAKLQYAKPNPSSGNDNLDAIDLGDIGEDTNADVISMHLEVNDGESLDKSQNGFIRRSIRALSENGYLKRAIVTLDGVKVNVLNADPKIYSTKGYEKAAAHVANQLRQQCSGWFAELRSGGVFRRPASQDIAISDDQDEAE